jgi:Fe-S-cluster containining protein
MMDRAVRLGGVQGTNVMEANLPPGMELRAIEVATPEGVMRGKVAVTTGPMRLSGLVRIAYEVTNALVARAVQVEEAAGRRISCCAGCGACCRHMVPVSPPEAFALADLLDRLTPARRRVVVQRFARIVETLQAQAMIDELLAPRISGEASLPIARRYFALGMACPFLEDESCSIHGDRPVVCRDFNVTSPAEWCRAPYEHDIAKVAMPLPLAAPLARLTAAVGGIEPCLIPLTLVPHWVARHDALRRREWPGPELFDRFLREIGTPRSYCGGGEGNRA